MNTLELNTGTLHECHSCGSNGVKTEWKNDSFAYGEGANAVQLNVLVPIRHCSACGMSYMDAEAEEIRHDAVCGHLRILTPREIVAIRERYGMTQQDFAQISKIGRASLTRWESGALYQNASNDNLLYLIGFPENLKRLAARVAQVSSEQVPRPRFRALSPEAEMMAVTEARKFDLFMTCH